MKNKQNQTKSKSSDLKVFFTEKKIFKIVSLLYNNFFSISIKKRK